MHQGIKNSSINFEVFTKEYYENAFVQLRKIPKNLSSEEIHKEIAAKMSLTFIPVFPLTQELIPGFYLYRVRSLKKGETIDETKKAEFSYPPVELCELGRCNKKEQQVLYTSADAHTAFQEKAETLSPGSIIYLSKWGIKPISTPVNINSFFLGISETDEGYASIVSKGLKENMDVMLKNMPEYIKERFLYAQKCYTELFVSPQKEHYHITSSIIYHTFYEMAKKGAQVPIVMYPSVAKRNSSVNFVFRKDFVDDNMYLKEVYKVVVKEISYENINVSVIGKGIVVGDSVEWAEPQIEVDAFNYSNCEISSGNPGQQFRRLNPGETLTSCCEKHTYSIRQFLEKNNVSETGVMEGLSKIPVDMYDYDEEKGRKYALLIQTTGDVYVHNNISEEGRIKYIMIPLTYYLKFTRK